MLAFGVAEIVAIVRRVENRCAGDDDLKGRAAVDDFLPKPFDLRFTEHFWQAVTSGCIVAIAAGIEHEEVDVGAAEACGDTIQTCDFDGLRPIGVEAVFDLLAVGVKLTSVYGTVVGAAPSGIVWDASEQGLKFGDATCFSKSFECAALRGPVAVAQVRGVASPDHEFWLFAKNA